MNTGELNKILQRNDVTREHYVGCFPADRIPSIGRTPCCMVINTGVSGTAGEHWVAVYVTSPTEADYFDSLGDWPPPSPHIDAFLRRFAHINHAPCPVQSDRSSACGKHVIYFLHRRCQGWPLLRVVWHLVHSRTGSDRLVCAFVRRWIFGEKANGI
jgi:hypothetical protein